ncbi:XK-related protein 2 [Danio rerio]|uniref:XK-related protein n=1 Tax=Danio rerio TaxID=7955 RepID=Q5U3R0_DANRE|nr:XK-related protein 2 [Danio rerio]AAH85430.1 XK, Kell blood group complex subunit-related, X-linked [Danio rerio]AAI39521.1 XK, Kell blood group complex subunit-related, X-linked [Danio rerio]AAI55741.1 XK, Kell blood group complex subunit-related, X-linked [Danio rerio]AAI65599.1 Xkrx protein [Danio rerio]AAI71373.1 XK, Kell blood group complex subunit-related, X-linked [Danio rerio]|eukprot:NP_001007407.1 XK-related protein 2 [Danio rerio]
MENNNKPSEHDITEAVAQRSVANPSENGVVKVINHGEVHPPFSVLWATVLYCAEFICASVLSSMYHKTEDVVWMGLTITFMLVPSVLTQLTLTFVHRDLGRDRPLVLFMHLLQMGPIIRCIEAIVVYCQAGKNEEPYVTISRKIKLKHGRGLGPAFECEIGHSERKLAVHRNAFKRTAVIQAFLGSTPQLTLQLYATIQEKYILLPSRLALMIISLISITYGALVCSVLAIQIKYDDYKVRMKPTAYLCMILWRGLEIATRITTLVLFSTAFTVWVVLVGLINLFIFFFQPWVEFWARRASLPENVENNFSKLGTTVVLCMVTFLYACINIFCWSAVQLNLADHDLVEKQPRWRSLAVYYTLRFVENVTLIVLWYYFKSDFYEYVCTPLLVVQLIVCYTLAVLFMLLFHQFCHPCRRLFHYNVEDCLRCACCWRKKQSQSLAEQADDPQVEVPPDLTNHLTVKETDILDDIMEAA